MSERTENTELEISKSESKEIELTHYMSDGPGYCGKLVFKIVKNILSIQSEVYDRVRPAPGTVLPTAVRLVDLPMDLPDVVGVSEVSSAAHMRALQSLLTPDDMEQLSDVEKGELYDLSQQARALTFSDGATGFLIVWGEPCYITLIKGSTVLQIEAYEDHSDVTLQEN